MISKADLIKLVRSAQAEADPGKREGLWKQVLEAGLPYDATIDESPAVGPDPIKGAEMETSTCPSCGEEIPDYRAMTIRCGPNEVKACPECLTPLPLPEEKKE